jgi:predicted transcriptional regulator
MSTAKEKMTEIIRSQPDDATYEEILRELAFERMVNRGLADVRQGRVLPDEEMKQRIRTWQK